MQTIRHLSVAVTVGALAFAGSAFAKGKAAPNCEVNGKQVHYRSKKSCEKRNGKWLEASGATSTTMPASSTSSSTTTTPAATPPASGTK